METTPEAQERISNTTEKATTKKKTGRAAKTRTQSSMAKGAARGATANAFAVTEAGQFGRVNILNFSPAVEDENYPARVELGETFTVSAQVFVEGRGKVNASAVLKTPRGREMMRVPMAVENAGLDTWTATLRVGEASDTAPWEPDFAAVKRQLGDWKVVIEAWEDSYADWLHDARIKLEIGDDVENVLAEGGKLLDRWAASKDAGLKAADKKFLTATAKNLTDSEIEPRVRFSLVDNKDVEALHAEHPLRDGLTASREHTFRVQRPKSSFCAWYQFFPRSEGAYVNESGERVQGNFHTAASGLERAKAQGFDVVYLPPIFPIGITNRKGKDGALVAQPGDPGSPFGIGSADGGHDTVDPLLGNYDDFKAFCARAHELGLEIALDFALQASPDHPWVATHPEWFRHKADGSIAYAENPPKKYQDIYPIDFDTDCAGIVKETVRLMNLWIEAGVTIFRVDNPHTKPVRFWQDVIAEVTKKHPETLFLAEAFTRPAMVRALSYAGFTQSHCYFPWRNGKEELEEFLLETNGTGGFYQHNTFWPTTPDILTDYLRDNGVAGHAVRAVLAAMGSPSWGIYSGYELIENSQREGSEEQSSNEKYEIKVRDWSKAEEYGIAELLTSLNAVRASHPAARSYHNLTVLPSANPNVIAFARHTPAEFTGTGTPDTLIIVINLDGHNAQQSSIHVPLDEFGFDTEHGFKVKDELTGNCFTWSWDNYVSLAPWADVAHIFSVQY